MDYCWLQLANASAPEMQSVQKFENGGPVAHISAYSNFSLVPLCAEVATTLPCRDAGRKSHEAVGETAANETRNAYS